MMKFSFFLMATAILSLSHQLADAQQFSISPNQRYLVDEEGKPFLYLGDTAWELFHRLSSEEARTYLKNRADKGFTVIQAVVLAQLGGLDDPNANGDLPLIDQNPSQPNEAYFKHVDKIIDFAEQLGLAIGLLPTWGSYWSETNGNDKVFDSESASDFAKFLAERYRDKRIIWILGGDENINTANERAIIEAMASGIEDIDDDALITFHPRGPGLSSDYFHESDWLDFNMYQSSHAARDQDNGLFALHDYELRPAKPTLDGEPRYEGIPVGFYNKGHNPADRFNDHDSRQAAYWSMLSGACGHTYGNNNIWQMWDETREPVIGANVPWFQAIDHPGAFQIKHLKKLFEARPFYMLEPSQKILTGHTAGVKGSLSKDRSFAIIYAPLGQPFGVDQSWLEGQSLRATWFDPRYGVTYPIHTGNTFGFQTYTPPSEGRGNDWILILDSADRLESFR